MILYCKQFILDQGGVEHTDPPFEWIEFRRKDGIYTLEIDKQMNGFKFSFQEKL